MGNTLNRDIGEGGGWLQLRLGREKSMWEKEKNTQHKTKRLQEVM